MAAQQIKYESTKIEATASASEVGALVQRYGAARFEMGWDDAGETEYVRFVLRAPGVGEVPVRIVARVAEVERILRRGHPSWTGPAVRGQAYRIAWRHLRDLTEQLLLAVKLGLKDVGGAFMDGVEVWDDVAGETVTMAEFLGRRAQLAAGDRGLQLLLAPRAEG